MNETNIVHFVLSILLPKSFTGKTGFYLLNIIIVNRDFIIDVSSNNVTIAITEDKLLTELHKEKHDNKFSVGDIYLGKVKR